MLPELLQIVCPHCDTAGRIARERLLEVDCLACGERLFDGRPAALKDERRFDRHVRRNDIPLLALFHAAWSAPSSALVAVLGEAAPGLEPELRLVTIDSALVPGLVERLVVERLPTLLLVSQRREVARNTGALNLAELLAWVDRHAAAAASPSGPRLA